MVYSWSRRLPCTSRSGPSPTFTDPALAHGGDHRLLDHGYPLAVGAFDLHAVLDPHHAFLDFALLLAVGILEDQRLAHAQRLAVHLVYLLAAVVLDPEVVADGDQILAHLVVRWRCRHVQIPGGLHGDFYLTWFDSPI